LYKPYLFANFKQSMQIKPIRLLLLLITVFELLMVCNSNAEDPSVHISPTPGWLLTYKPYNQSIPLRDVENGYFYQLYEEQLQVEKQADYTHIIKQIISEAGIQNGSEISISFDPSYQRIDFHQLTVWRDNKPQNRLNSSAFKMIADEKELSRFIYQGTYSAYCILNDIRKGDRIEYAYTITGRNPIFNNKYFEDIYFQGSQSIAHQYISVQASPLRQLNFKTFNKVPKTIASVKNGLNCYEWEDFQDKPGDTYDNEPGWHNSYAYIQISEYSTWKQVVDWAIGINPVSGNLSGDLANRVAALKAASAGDKEKYFRNAVKMVQDEVRYMGIEMGEYSHKANNPEKVYEQRYGDCKDKSRLLASILTAGGIEANMVLINTGARAKTHEFMPSSYVFDHVVVMAQVGNKQVYVDPTISYQRGTGTNIYFPDYGEGLVLKAGNNALTTLPLSPVGKITCTEKYTIPDEKGKVHLDVTTIYTLNQADDIRDWLASAGMAETEKNYLDYYAKTYPKIESADSVAVLDDEGKNELTTIEHYLIPSFFKKDTEPGRYAASLYANYISEQLISVPEKVHGPIAVNYPYAIDYTINVVLPSGWSIDGHDTVIKRDAYKFESHQSAEEEMLTLNYKFSYLKNYIPADKLDEYRQDVKQLSDSQLSFGFTYTPDVDKIPFRLNYWMVIFVVVLIGVIAAICTRIYRTETARIMFTHGSSFVPIGGWLILIAIGLALTVIINPITFFTSGYFDLDKWNIKQGTIMDTSYKALFLFEVIGNIILTSLAAFCFILLLNKRDILPKCIIAFYAFALCFFIGDYIFAMLINNGEAGSSVRNALFRSIITAGIWIPYFRISLRVKETFIVPYPANNYSYEMHQTEQPVHSPATDAPEE